MLRLPPLSRNCVVVIAIAGLMSTAAFWGLSAALHELHANWTAAFGHYSHGYLVLCMSVWLAWRSWSRRPIGPTSPGWLALPLLAVLVSVMFVSMVTSVDTATQSLLPLIALAAIAAAFGWPMARRLFWPLMFLYTALPVSWYFNTPLQDMTALVVNSLVKLTNVPAFVEGNTFHLPAGTLEIAAGCSGLRFMNTAVALSLFQGLLFLQSWRDRMKLIAVAIIFALLANWLRVYSLMVIAYATDMRHYLIRVEHLYYGWAVFLVCMWPVFWYGARLERQSPESSVPATHETERENFHPGLALLSALLVSGLLLVPRLIQSQLEERAKHSSTISPLSDSSPESRNAWILGDKPFIAGAEEERASYLIDGESVWFYRATALQPSQLVTWPTDGSALISSNWVSRKGMSPPTGTNGRLHFEQLHGELRGTEVLIRTASVVAGYSAFSTLDQKLAVLRGLLEGRQDAVMWLVVTPCKPDCATGEERLNTWLSKNSALLNSD